MVELLFSGEKVDGLINGNFIEPTEEFEFRVKGFKLLECFDEHRLRDVFSIFLVQREAECKVKNRFLIAIDQDLKGLLIAFDAMLNQYMILFVFHELHRSIDKVGVRGNKLRRFQGEMQQKPKYRQKTTNTATTESQKSCQNGHNERHRVCAWPY